MTYFGRPTDPFFERQCHLLLLQQLRCATGAQQTPGRSPDYRCERWH